MNTSINLHFMIAQEISIEAEKRNLSQSEITKKLISKISNFKNLKQVEKTLIEYQDRVSRVDECGDKISAYEKVHYCPDEDMIDYCKWLRFTHRISLSKLVAASFLFFWEEILDEISGNHNIKDNYEEIIRYFDQLKEYFLERLNYEEIEAIKRE